MFDEVRPRQITYRPDLIGVGYYNLQLGVV